MYSLTQVVVCSGVSLTIGVALGIFIIALFTVNGGTGDGE